MYSLEGRTSLVTGSSRGIGAGIAITLAKQGADVHVHYSASPEAALEIVLQIRAMGRKADMIQSDLSGKSCGKEIMAAVKASDFGGGKLDIIVLNAAVSRYIRLEEISEDNIDDVYTNQMDINVRSNILIMSNALPLLNRGGRIVMISSISPLVCFSGSSVYASSKSMIQTLAKIWAKELGQKYGITVNCVNPGPVRTAMFDAVPASRRAAVQPMIDATSADGRPGEVDDVADIVSFLCSEESRWVTGSTVCGHGGIVTN